MSRVEEVLNWYTENDKNDPNMYELIEVLSEYSRNADESKEKVENLVKLELTRLFANRIIRDTNDSLVKMVMEFMEKAVKGEAVPEELENYAKKVAGVSFWLKTEYSRGATFEYDNNDEYREMQKLESDVRNAGIDISVCIHSTKSFIEEHCSRTLKETKEPPYVYWNIQKEISKNANSRMRALIMTAEPYVYPEKLNQMLENKSLLEATIPTVIDLGQGLDFDTVRNRLSDRGLSEAFRRFVLAQTVLYAKQGPEFYKFSADKDGFTFDSAWLEELKEENKKLAEKYGEKVDSDNYSK